MKIFVVGALALAGLGPAAAQSGGPAARGGEPAVQRSVIEDDAVRIEELRVRGQAQSITVRPKMAGVRPYQILPGNSGRDPSQARDGAGQRVWQMFTF
jgi:hypothetical protein